MPFSLYSEISSRIKQLAQGLWYRTSPAKARTHVPITRLPFSDVPLSHSRHADFLASISLIHFSNPGI